MADAIEGVEGRVRAVAAVATVAGLLCAFVTPALAEDRIHVPCEEHKRVTGEDLCHVHPTLSWTSRRGRVNLRHTFASHAVLRGIPLPVVSRMLGHKRPSMTLRYAHVGDRETEAAAERIGAAIARAIGGDEASLSD